MLSDKKQREEYDAVRQMAQGGARFRAGGPGGAGGFEDVFSAFGGGGGGPVSYTHLRAHETVLDLVCRLLLEKKKKTPEYDTSVTVITDDVMTMAHMRLDMNWNIV